MNFYLRSHWGYAGTSRNPQSPSSHDVNAAVKFKSGSVLFREKPFLEDWRGKLLNFHLNPNPTGVAERDGVRSPIEMIDEVQKNLNRLSKHAAQFYFDLLEPSDQQKWMALEDNFREIPSRSKTTVAVFGIYDLPRVGITFGRKGKGHKKGKIFVFIVNDDREDGEWMWLDAMYIKTIYGILKSNIFPSGLFEDFSGTRHDCSPNTIMVPVDRINRRIGRLVPGFEEKVLLEQSKSPFEHALVATRDIHEGEDITMCYLGSREDKSRSTRTRRAILEQKYGFVCHCKSCVNNVYC
ncbi:hypothetical protein THAOC_30979 [Thalassiosira oceanica]|uniref:SET domain-containing protein n=1 Tax=Thalassiosira oceanica TaxID=159749 RepID=K0R950_THAOC|nr:hypothetical protein THAOC_30979 [Thalassiosira oceanica]|eukprot:EJK50088.1 hypothetical protein THAOC_30979 [Thalassiosira oceanica]